MSEILRKIAELVIVIATEIVRRITKKEITDDSRKKD